MSQNTQPSIEVEGLIKRYGDFQALHGISFTVQPGEIVGFLGPNGAGKTTTMKILTCFMGASEGTARVAGHDVHEDSERVRQKIGYLPENVPLYDEMLVYDYLAFIAQIRGVPAEQHRAQIKRVVELTGLTPMIAKPIQELSKGYRQRVGLAQAIIHEPDVVILDEPTGGLDPNQILDIRDVIKKIGKEKTVLFSTHIMQEVEAVCDRVILINRGQIVANDTISNLRSQLAANRPGLLVSAEGVSIDDLQKVLEKIEGVRSAHAEGNDEIRVQGDDLDAIRRAIFALGAQGKLAIRRVSPYTPSLEDIFRHFTYNTPDPVPAPQDAPEAKDADKKTEEHEA
jgi:ABC-2 type transport system ATP-binding protein